MKKVLFLLIGIGVFWEIYSYSEQVSLGPGVKAPEQPQQEAIGSNISYDLGEYTANGLANFSIRAKVLAKKNYRFGKESDLSPTDLALGWGNMSDENVLQHIKISQSRRFYYWKVESFPIPRREIETHSANMHLIPADAAAQAAIDRVRQGDIVEISGQLVNVESKESKWQWTSSTTRTDTGAGACELFYVKKLNIVSQEV